MLSREVQPNLFLIATPGEMTGYRKPSMSPFEVSPGLPEVANINLLQLEDRSIGLAELSKQVAENIHAAGSQYSGFVVTAGKDSIMHLAPRIAFALGPDLDKTVVITGTNISADYGHSEAEPDLIRAAMVAGKPFNEVVIAFNHTILRGTSFTLEHSRALMRYAARDPWDKLGEITASGIEVSYTQTKSPEVSDTFHNDFETDVPAIVVTPGFEAEYYRNIIGDHKGFVIDSVDWNLPTVGSYSAVDLITDILNKNIPVMLTSRVNDSLVPEDETLPGEQIVEGLGGVAGRYMTPETGVAKFSWVLKVVEKEMETGNLSEDKKLSRVRELMRKPYVGEFGLGRPFNSYKV